MSLVRTKIYLLWDVEKSSSKRVIQRGLAKWKSNSLPLLWFGLAAEKHFQTPAGSSWFLHAKGILEALFARLGLQVTYTATSEIAGASPSRTYILISLGDRSGFLASTPWATAKAYDIPGDLCSELNLQPSKQLLQPAAPFRKLRSSWAVSRDIALLLKAEVTTKKWSTAIQAVGVKTDRYQILWRLQVKTTGVEVHGL